MFQNSMSLFLTEFLNDNYSNANRNKWKQHKGCNNNNNKKNIPCPLYKFQEVTTFNSLLGSRLDIQIFLILFFLTYTHNYSRIISFFLFPSFPIFFFSQPNGDWSPDCSTTCFHHVKLLWYGCLTRQPFKGALQDIWMLCSKIF